MANENPYAKYAQRTQAPSRGVVIADPYREAEEQRKEAEELRRQQDQQFEAQRVAIAQQQASIAAQNAATTAANANKPPAGYRWNEEGGLEVIPGGPADRAASTKPINPDRVAQIEALLGTIKRLREKADDTLAVGSWSEYWRDTPFLNQNRRDIEAALEQVEGDLIQQQIAVLNEMNGGKGVATMANSETEARRMAASIANLSPNQRREEFLIGLDKAEQFYLRQLDRQTARSGSAPVNMTAAGSGATERAVPIPAEMQAENEAWLRDNLGKASPQDYARFRQQLDRKYGFEPPPEAGLVSWFEGAQRSGNPTTTIPPVSEDLSGIDWLRNEIISNPAGSFLASAANAGGFGLPSLMAGDEYAAMREMNPTSSTLGEIEGAITGTFSAGAGLGALGGRVGNETIARLLANPLTADMAYGGVYGATQSDDPLYGAVGGAASAAAGNFIGGQIAKRIPGIVGMRRSPDTMAPGERRVFEAVERTGIDPVVDALLDADELGVPASLADVSSDVGSLTGAALRRSPAAAGEARRALANRSAEQFDRFTSAVERDLGPIQNIPQRSEELIAQARTAAGPLYESAYAAPGASSVQLDDLMSRPSMNRVLAKARRIAAEEGRDPTALGFDLDDAGEVVLTRVPSFQTLDYMKRGFDDVLEGYRDKTTGRLVLDTEGRAINATLQDFLARVDKVNPDYAAARTAYAGPASEREWMRRGERMLTTTPDQLSVIAGNATPEQLAQMQLGAQSELARRAGDRGLATNPWRLIETPNMESRLASLYPEGGDRIARLLAQRDLERQLAASTNRLVGNSATAERQLADQAFGQSSLAGDMATGAIETLLTGAPVVTAARSGIGRSLGNAVRDWRTLGFGNRATALADEIAPIALNTNPGAAALTVADLAARDADYDVILAALMDAAQERGSRAGAGVATALVN